MSIPTADRAPAFAWIKSDDRHQPMSREFLSRPQAADVGLGYLPGIGLSDVAAPLSVRDGSKHKSDGHNAIVAPI